MSHSKLDISSWFELSSSVQQCPPRLDYPRLGGNSTRACDGVEGVRWTSSSLSELFPSPWFMKHVLSSSSRGLGNVFAVPRLSRWFHPTSLGETIGRKCVRRSWLLRASHHFQYFVASKPCGTDPKDWSRSPVTETSPDSLNIWSATGKKAIISKFQLFWFPLPLIILIPVFSLISLLNSQCSRHSFWRSLLLLCLF